ncbi:hypothetical protein ACFYXH_32070 [Streptomyces sp. NPDC002730]|uniref:hypothetical protein n=1 Tax=Streptomyces sp. NPDC002730 TaxID=3364662 RepID=UPI0036A453E2
MSGSDRLRLGDRVEPAVGPYHEQRVVLRRERLGGGPHQETAALRVPGRQGVPDE